MKIQIKENEFLLLALGQAKEEHGVVTREVSFEFNGNRFEREIVLRPNGTGADYEEPEKFYMMNKEMVDASLVEYLAEQH
ncbi:hypothetical protein [Chryseobacterium sp.]|uniref:hypothetical protein n=1 Tax=Chryseobacterium sp. TaxID=1871047 RepID=UPI0011C9FB91|nr:hypothetical protein [Chryseobacterium sp.]TXF79199.1 hypothetical protein FUA25_02050 [Chryseobacterium sp.]